MANRYQKFKRSYQLTKLWIRFYSLLGQMLFDLQRIFKSENIKSMRKSSRLGIKLLANIDRLSEMLLEIKSINLAYYEEYGKNK